MVMRYAWAGVHDRQLATEKNASLGKRSIPIKHISIDYTHDVLAIETQ